MKKYYSINNFILSLPIINLLFIIKNCLFKNKINKINNYKMLLILLIDNTVLLSIFITNNIIQYLLTIMLFLEILVFIVYYKKNNIQIFAFMFELIIVGILVSIVLTPIINLSLVISNWIIPYTNIEIFSIEIFYVLCFLILFLARCYLLIKVNEKFNIIFINNKTNIVIKYMFLIFTILSSFVFVSNYEKDNNIFKYMLLNPLGWWDFNQAPINGNIYNKVWIKRDNEAVYFLDNKIIDQENLDATKLSIYNYYHLNDWQNDPSNESYKLINQYKLELEQNVVYNNSNYKITFNYYYINAYNSYIMGKTSYKLHNYLEIEINNHNLDENQVNDVINKAYEHITNNVLNQVFSSQTKFSINRIGNFSNIIILKN